MAPGDLRAIRDEIERTPGVNTLLDLLTMYLGSENLIVAFSDGIGADRVEDIADDIAGGSPAGFR